MEIKSLCFFVVQVSKQQREVQVAGAWPCMKLIGGHHDFGDQKWWEGFAVCPEFCLAEKSGASKNSAFRSILQAKIVQSQNPP